VWRARGPLAPAGRAASASGGLGGSWKQNVFRHCCASVKGPVAAETFGWPTAATAPRGSQGNGLTGGRHPPGLLHHLAGREQKGPSARRASDGFEAALFDA